MVEDSVYNYKPDLGNRIRALRNEQGLSLRKFGLMVDVDYTYLFDIERGHANATVDTIAKIASGLGVDMKELFDFEK